jgi:4'-phosphopantetheinyl transferase
VDVWEPAGDLDARLSPDEVHVWCAALDCDSAMLASLASVLSDDERARAQRYQLDAPRDRFIAARGMLRWLLGRYLERDPSGIELAIGANGKPAAADAAGASTVHFNVAHSADVALYAFSSAAPLGVDVEVVVPRGDVRRIAERFFSAAESAVVRSTPAADLLRVFFEVWTRKEAYIKATGRGLSERLDSFDVPCGLAAPAPLLRVDDGHGDAAAWSIYHLEPRPGVIGALAIQGSAWRVRMRHLARTAFSPRTARCR